MKQKLTVVTEFGTFSRTTARSYQFVIASRGKTLAAEESKRQAYLAQFRENLAYYQSRPDCERDVAIVQANIATYEAPDFAARQAAAITLWGWSGDRLNAEKVAQKARSDGYQDVRIFPV